MSWWWLLPPGYIAAGVIAARVTYILDGSGDRDSEKRSNAGFAGAMWPIWLAIMLVWGFFAGLGWIAFRPTRSARRKAAVKRAEAAEAERMARVREAEYIIADPQSFGPEAMRDALARLSEHRGK